MTDVNLLFEETQKLDAVLRKSLQQLESFTKDIDDLREKIKLNYQTIIFQDIIFAHAKDIDHILWKSVFYKSTEVHRRILRQLSRLDKPHSNAIQLELQRQSDEFSNFLSTTYQFYIEIIRTLVLKFQLPTVQIVLDNPDSNFWISKALHLSQDGLVNSINSFQQQMAMKSCVRIFIFMGDIMRYQRDLSKEHAHEYYKSAVDHYKKAIFLMPHNGNPHNQIAVLATNENELESMYRYYRSLAADVPFLTAKDNLKIQFEKNRKKYELSASSSRHFFIVSKSRKFNRIKGQTLQQQIQEYQTNFLSVFLRLHGMIFTWSTTRSTHTISITNNNSTSENSTNLNNIDPNVGPESRSSSIEEEFHELKSAVVGIFDILLKKDAVSEEVLLKSTFMNTFLLEFHAEQLIHNESLLCMICEYVVEFMTLIVTRSIRCKNNSKHLSTLIFMLSWINNQLHLQPFVYAFRQSDTPTDYHIRTINRFWKAVASLLNLLASTCYINNDIVAYFTQTFQTLSEDMELLGCKYLGPYNFNLEEQREIRKSMLLQLVATREAPVHTHQNVKQFALPLSFQHAKRILRVGRILFLAKSITSASEQSSIIIPESCERLHYNSKQQRFFCSSAIGAARANFPEITTSPAYHDNMFLSQGESQQEEQPNKLENPTIVVENVIAATSNTTNNNQVRNVPLFSLLEQDSESSESGNSLDFIPSNDRACLNSSPLLRPAPSSEIDDTDNQFYHFSSSHSSENENNSFLHDLLADNSSSSGNYSSFAHAQGTDLFYKPVLQRLLTPATKSATSSRVPLRIIRSSNMDFSASSRPITAREKPVQQQLRTRLDAQKDSFVAPDNIQKENQVAEKSFTPTRNTSFFQSLFSTSSESFFALSPPRAPLPSNTRLHTSTSSDVPCSFTQPFLRQDASMKSKTINKPFQQRNTNTSRSQRASPYTSWTGRSTKK